jgi:hypothetical protein
MCYGAPRKLPKTLESIRSQKFNPKSIKPVRNGFVMYIYISVTAKAVMRYETGSILRHASTITLTFQKEMASDNCKKLPSESLKAIYENNSLSTSLCILELEGDIFYPRGLIVYISLSLVLKG